MPREPKPRARKTTRRVRAERQPRGTTGDSLNAYIREISRFKPLSGEHEKELGRRIRMGDQEALQRLVEANLRFVVSYSKRYRGLGLSFLDLIHEGTLGLIEAACRFDPERNVKFISYAVWWVRQAIFHALSEHMRVFRLPQKLSSQVAKMGTARQRRTLELGDVLEQGSVPSAELELIRTSFEEQVRAMVSHLDEKEREVIKLRFGLDGDEPRTLQEIGESLGLSRERIRQIESKAKEKLRRSHEVQGLRGALN